MLSLVFDKKSDFSTYSQLIKSEIRSKAIRGEMTTGNFLLDYVLGQLKEVENNG